MIIIEHDNDADAWTLKVLLLPSPVWAKGTLCVCVTINYYCCLNSIISKSKQVAALKIGNLRQTVVLYKIGKLFQASMARTACKFENNCTDTFCIEQKMFESS